MTRTRTPSPAGKTRLPVAKRRDALVTAALRVIARDGVAAASTRAISAEADMPQASFHYAFESRDALMREVVRRAVEAEEATILPVLAPDSVPTDMRRAIRAGLEHLFAGVVADPGRERAMLELALYAQHTPGAEDLARYQYDAYAALAVSALEAGAHLTRCRWTVPVDEAARLLISLTDGLIFNWLATGDDDTAARMIALAADTVARLSEPLLDHAGLDEPGTDETDTNEPGVDDRPGADRPAPSPRETAASA